MRSLEGRVALVTGASRGIGRAIALSLGEQGAAVAVNYKSNQTEAAQVVTTLREKGVKAEAVQFDVSDSAAVDKAIKDIAATFGGLHILVNNAGVASNTLTLGATEASYRLAIEVNLSGTFYCTRAALRSLMRAAGGGRIVNITSVIGEAGSAGQGPYAAAKAGVIGLTKTWAREYASRGITVNAVAPGIIDTDMTASELPEAKRAEVLKAIPLGRVGTVDDVAHAVAFLAGPQSSYITGQVLRVNGGLLM